MILRPLIAFLLLGLAGCATVSSTREPDISGPAGERDRDLHFEPIAGRGPDVIAAMRAAPPPTDPELVSGTLPNADQRALGAQSYVAIGSARYPNDDAGAPSEALALGRRLGADKVLAYAHDGDGAALAYRADYYVRFKLPFGATFRDLTASERQTLGDGVEIGNVVRNTPAADANLLDGDFVLKLNGAPIAGKADFQSRLRANSGKAVTLTIQRDGVTIERVVRLGIAPAAPTRD